MLLPDIALYDYSVKLFCLLFVIVYNAVLI